MELVLLALLAATLQACCVCFYDDAAQEAYVESTETYTKLFEDAGKYRAIMNALAQAMFDELKNEEVTE